MKNKKLFIILMVMAMVASLMPVGTMAQNQDPNQSQESNQELSLMITAMQDPSPIELEEDKEITEEELIETFPKIIVATIDEKEQEVPVSSWTMVYSSTSNPFIANVQGEYYYEPTLIDGYTISKEVSMVAQKVTVGQAIAHEPALIDTGDFTVVGDNSNYSFSDSTLTIIGDGQLTISNKDPNTPTWNIIEVQDGITANLILNGVNIDSGYDSALLITGTSHANITLEGTNILKSGDGFAGIQVQSDGSNTASLTITSQSTGSLTINGGANGAGIGGGYNATGGNGGNVTINGGTVNAIGNNGGAGIGGGNRGDGGNVTIKGGTVNATGNNGGSGIGGGNRGDGGNVTINGGTVNAISDEQSSGSGFFGIGGGLDGNSHGTFSTGTDGTATIYTTEIGDKSQQDQWYGVIIYGAEGIVRGTQTLSNDLFIKTGFTVEFDTNSSLTIPQGITLIISRLAVLNISSTNEDALVNNGIIYNYGEIINSYLITGSGEIYPANHNPTHYISASHLFLQTDGSTKQLSFNNTVTWHDYTGTVTITGETDANDVKILSGEHDIILNNMKIENSDLFSFYPFTVRGTSIANITLVNENSLIAGNTGAGLNVHADNTGGTRQAAVLNILANSSGSLVATGGENGAGIGNKTDEDSGDINIEGGTIIANAGANANGIGGNSAVINISGGTVTATSKAGNFGISAKPSFILPNPNSLYSVSINEGSDSKKISDNFQESSYVKIAMSQATTQSTLTPTPALTYTGQEQTQQATIKLGGATIDSSNYTLSDNKATVAGNNYLMNADISLGSDGVYDNTAGTNYMGSSQASGTFAIYKAPIKVTGVDAQSKVYDGNNSISVNNITLDGFVNGETLTNGEDYSLSNLGFNSVNAGDDLNVSGSITLNNTAKANNYVLETENFNVNSTADISQKPIDSAIIGLGTALVFNGQEQAQTISSITVDGVTLVEGTDYTISNNKVTNVGDYTLTINGIGNYSGSVTKEFTVSEEITPPLVPDSGSLNHENSVVPDGNTLVETPLSPQQEKEDLDKLNEYIEQNGIKGTITYLKDITMKDADGNIVQPSGNNTKIRIAVNGLTTKDRVRVLHIKDDGSVEEITPVEVYNGYVEFYPTSFSTYSVIVEKYDGSPDTGDNTNFLWLGMLLASSVFLLTMTISKRAKQR